MRNVRIFCDICGEEKKCVPLHSKTEFKLIFKKLKISTYRNDICFDCIEKIVNCIEQIHKEGKKKK